MGWGNPVVAGTVLQAAAIRSPNYVPGSVGWTVNQDGSVEFNNGTFRGIITAGSFFLYHGTPGFGNSPVFWASNANTDPYGNSLPSTAGVSGTGSFSAGNTIINPTGTFSYNGTPALGNLISSTGAVAAGTDQFGNAYLAGTVGYGQNGGLFYAIQSGWANSGFPAQIIFSTATAAGGPWTQQGVVSCDVTGHLFIRSERAGGAGIIDLSAAANVVINNNNLAAAIPGSNPVMAETWRSFAGNYQNSWGPAAAGSDLKSKLSPDGFVHLTGRLMIPTGVSNPSTIATLSGPYSPARTEPLIASAHGGSSPFTGAIIAVLIDTGGNIKAFGGMSAGNTLEIQGRFPLDA